MLGLITGFTDEVAKNGKRFLKIDVATEDKSRRTLYLWKDWDNFIATLSRSRFMELNGSFDSQYPEINTFKESKGELSKFVETAFVSDDYANKFLDNLLRSITEPEFVDLNNKLFAQNSRIRKAFVTYPAAKSMHHNFRGGLLLHTYEVLKFVSTIAKVQEFGEVLDMQVLLEGALLHDLGKIDDYKVDEECLDIQYSEAISLSSHLSRGCEYIARFAENPDSPKMRGVKHIINSHHFFKDWDAVNTPKTREALLVFLGDYYSAFNTKFAHAQFDGALGHIGRDNFINIADLPEDSYLVYPEG